MKSAGLSESDDNIRDKLGLLQTASITSDSLAREKLYCFPHLTLQEFLAAIHLTLLDDHTQVNEIGKLYNRNPLNPIFPLYAGLTCLANEKVLKILSSALETSLDDASVLMSICRNPSRAGDPRQKALAFFNCLYDCHNDKLMISQNTQLKPNLLFLNNLYQIIMTQFSMTPADCLALGYFVRYAISHLKSGSFLQVHLGMCSDVGISSFLTEVTKGMNSGDHRQVTGIHPSGHKGIGLFLFDYVPQDDSSPLALKRFLQSQGSPYAKMLQLAIGSGTSRNVMHAFLKHITEGITANSTCLGITLIFLT